MPELSPKQVAIWLAVAVAVLWIGGKALRGGGEATELDVSALGGADGASAGLESGAGDSPSGGTAGSGAADGAGEAGETGEAGEGIWVHVAGAVRRPGLYRLSAGSRVAAAVRQAGGPRRGADLDLINLAAAVADGQQILVPRRGAPGAVAASAPGRAGAGVGGGGDGSDAAATGSGGAISLATATAEQLETIDGVGPVTAGKILAFRDSQGGVSSIEQLDAIPGIGPATMESLRQALVP